MTIWRFTNQIIITINTVVQALAAYAEQHIDDTEAPVFLRFINLLINDAIFLLDEALSVSVVHLSVFLTDWLQSSSLCSCCCGSPAALLFSSTDVSYPGLGSLLPPPGCPRDPVL